MSKLGIVTVTYNGRSVLPDFVRCLKAQTHDDFVVYVVDNHSTDGSADEAERLLLEAGLTHQIVRNDANRGVARANNQGIRLALEQGCGRVVIANNDIEFAADTFARVARMPADPKVLIAPLIVFHDAPDVIWSAGGHVSWLRGVPRTRGYRRRERSRFSKPGYTGHAATCFLVVPAQVFGDIGLMDEDFFVYLDDSDFVVRAVRAGCRILFTPEPVIHHKVSVSTGGADSPFTIQQIAKNTILFLHKNNSPPSALWYILVFLARSGLRLLRYDEVQRSNMYEGIRAGLEFVFRRPVSKHSIPTL